VREQSVSVPTPRPPLNRRCQVCGYRYETTLAECPFDNVALAKPRPGTEYLGAYRLIERLAVGGMGAVYRALHEKSGRAVAIKLLHQSLRNEVVSVSRFFHEARAVNTIRHPNVVEVYDLSGEGEDVYMVLELLRGKDLRTLLGEQPSGALPATRAVTILEQVCGALQATHARKIVHRDLKPENVFLSNRNGRNDFVKLLDFGVAKLERPEGRLTREGIALGTPEYMAPEQARGADVDARTDVYAVGCIAYEMLTSRTVFHGGSPGEVMIRQVREPPRPPRELNPTIPESLEQVVLRCLAKSPKSRPQSAMELAQALTAAVGLDFDASGAFLEWKGWEGPSSHSAVEMPAVKVTQRPSQVLRAVRNVVTARRRAIAAGGGLVLVGMGTWLGLRGGNEGNARVSSEVMAAVRPALAPLPVAQVLLQSTPAGAEVIDEAGRRLGITPHRLSVPATGSKRVRLMRSGYLPSDEVVVRGDAPGGAVDVVLQAAPRSKGKRPSRPANTVVRNRQGR
jgi:serine/threonine protein kinase